MFRTKAPSDFRSLNILCVLGAFVRNNTHFHATVSRKKLFELYPSVTDANGISPDQSLGRKTFDR